MEGKTKENVVFDVALEAHITEGAEFEGREWDVTIIGESERSPVVKADGRSFIRSANGRLYPLEVLEASAPSWDGIRVYDNHLTDEEFAQRGGMRSVAKEWIGNIVKSRWSAAKRALVGVFKVVDRQLAQKFKDAWDQGTLKTVGFSLDAFTEGGQPLTVEGQRLPVVEGFTKQLSVDLVAEPAAGGGFNRLIAAEQINTEVNTMNEQELKELVRRLVSEALADKQVDDKKREALEVALYSAAIGAKAAEAEDPEAAVKALMEGMVVIEAAQDPAPPAEPPEDPQPRTDTPPVEEPDKEGNQEALDAVQQQIKALECQIMLERKVAAAKLPAKAAEHVHAHFKNRVFEEEELDNFIKSTKEVLAISDPSGNPKGTGQQRDAGLQHAISPEDKAEVEFLRLVMGNTAFRSLESAEESFVQERVSEAYKSWVNDGRPYGYGGRRLSEWVYSLLDGDPFVDQRAYEAVTTSGMSSIVKSALNVMLANDYAKRQRWWDPIVTVEEVDTIDQATLVRVFGLSTLDVVNEGQAYDELTWADEEETASFVKKGNYVGVTLETLLKDKVQSVRSLPNRLATSWHNTISALVDGVFTCNTDTGPVLSTGGALFNATAVASSGGHANLGSSALGFSTFSAAQTAMMKQTDQPSGAGQRLLIRPRYLVVPVDLEPTALMIRNSEYYPGSQDNDINPFYQKFDIVVNPVEDDTNNWYCVADPKEFPAIWLIFLRGRRVPELFSAGDESSGAMFTNDVLRYKVRLMTWRFSSTYECAPVSDFRPLYKSNC